MSEAKKIEPATVAGRMIGTLIPLGLMIWSAFETTSAALRGALVGWIVLSLLIYVGCAAILTLRAGR